jgi:hypothetical protein
MHDHDENSVILAPGDDPNSLMTVVVGVISCVLLLAILFGLEAIFYGVQQREFEAKVIAREPVELQQVRAEALEAIRDYRWIDAENGVVGIPIERATELLIEEHRGRENAAER